MLLESGLRRWAIGAMVLCLACSSTSGSNADAGAEHGGGGSGAAGGSTGTGGASGTGGGAAGTGGGNAGTGGAGGTGGSAGTGGAGAVGGSAGAGAAGGMVGSAGSGGSRGGASGTGGGAAGTGGAGGAGGGATGGSGGGGGASGTGGGVAGTGGAGGGACGSCDDQDPCTVDLCDTTTGCRHVNASACAQPICQLGSSCATWRDSDRDGLSDEWETNGYVDLNCNGVNDGPSVDLQLPGADPAIADVYVQYDWMDYGPLETPCNTNGDCTLEAGQRNATCTGPAPEGFSASCVIPCVVDGDCTSLGPTHATDHCAMVGVKQCVHSHDPVLLAPNGTGGSTALDLVVEAFARHGINLHIVRGHAQPHSHVLSRRTLAELSHSCEGGSLADGTAGAGKYAESLYDLKAGSFDSKRAVVYHYAIFGHHSTCDTQAHCQACPVAFNPDGTPKGYDQFLVGLSGLSEVGGNDFIISLANVINEVGNPPERFLIGGTFMHELGHNLGLDHPIVDQYGLQPNRLSDMSGPLFVSDNGTGSDEVVDYQRVHIPALNEASLDEQTGIGVPEAHRFYIFHSCPPADDTHGINSSWPGDGDVDWDCSGHPFAPDIQTTPVQADIDGNGTMNDILPATDPEWPVLDYRSGGHIGP